MVAGGLVGCLCTFLCFFASVSTHPHVTRALDARSFSWDTAQMSADFKSMFSVQAVHDLETGDGSTSDPLVIEKFLTSLNKLRYMHDAKPVYWKMTLQKYATAWANKCPDKHSFGPYGETMGSGGNSAAFDPKSFGEEAAWNDKPPKTTSDFLKSGHFFTEMWKATRYIGCARVWCDAQPIHAWISVCEYEHSASTTDFTANVSPRSNDGPPPGWNPPENHVHIREFPNIVSPAASFPPHVSRLPMTLNDLPPDVVASATKAGKGYLPGHDPASKTKTEHTQGAMAPPAHTAPVAEPGSENEAQIPGSCAMITTGKFSGWFPMCTGGS